MFRIPKKGLGDWLDKLEEAIRDVLGSEYSTGCVGDVTVVSAAALDKLRSFVSDE